MAKAEMKTELREKIIGELALYGATLDDNNVICKGGRQTGIRVVKERARLRFEDADKGFLLMSGPAVAKTAGDFVEGFWYWKKI